ncbi:MAG: RnfH family protein [Polaromonas sp.]|nr:RnfH family protein [Polaromonas sp.]
MRSSSAQRLSTARPEAPVGGAVLAITLVFSPAPRQLWQWTLALPAGSSVAQALQASPLFLECPELLASRLRVGIWGCKAGLDRLLADNDRIEIYRPLRVDPKTARRERFGRQGAKSAGLFMAKRPGSKSGY